MPEIEVLLFKDEDDVCPFLMWLDQLQDKVQDKCIVRIERLSELGFELRRPEADFLRDGMYELRIAFQHVQYRILYFFHEQNAVLSHGLVKQQRIPDTEIEKAIRHKELFANQPNLHTFED